MQNIIIRFLPNIAIIVIAIISLGYGFSARIGKKKGSLSKPSSTEKDDCIKAGLPAVGFSRQEYVVSHSANYGISNMGVSLDERVETLYVVPLDFNCD